VTNSFTKAAVVSRVMSAIALQVLPVLLTTCQWTRNATERHTI